VAHTGIIQSSGAFSQKLLQCEFSTLCNNVCGKAAVTWFSRIVCWYCENCSLTFRKEFRLRVNGNRVLRRMLGPDSVVIVG
jgi:hypothetical protein